MKILSYISVLLLSVSTAHAHIGGHGYLMEEKEIIPVATEHVAFLIQEKQEMGDAGVLDSKWNKVTKEHKTMTKYEGFYVVRFDHPKEKKSLYLLLANTGDLYGINYTGIFEGLETRP